MAVFKSYDIRGVYPDQLDANLARKIGLGLGRFYKELPVNAGKEHVRVVVGRDMRQSAPEMGAACIDGLRAAGCHVIDIGMVTTPCVYFAVQRLEADAGVQCTASHNPPQYIGFKVTRELAIPISYDTGLNQVEAMLDQPAPDVTPGGLETVDVDEAYLDYLASLAQDQKPIKVAADGSNGMAGKYLQRLFERLPAELAGLYLEPDGTFPNHEADPLKAENMRDVQKLVVDSGARIGFCFDGDADRVAIVDEKGEIVGCDMITALLGRQALTEAGPGNKVSYDLRSSKAVAEVIEAAGGEAVRSRVGHSHVKNTMRQQGIIAGGELSGHYYFKLEDKVTYYADSALVAVVKLLNLLSQDDTPVSEMLAPIKRYYHTGEINFAIDDKDAALAAIRETFSDGKQDELDGVSVDYPNWWLNVRPSNTEPLLRLTLEGDTPELRDAGLAKVEAVLTKFGHRASSSH